MSNLTTVRYIDANKLMSDLCLRSCYNREHRCDNDSAANEDLAIVEMIKTMPTVDAEPVRHGQWIVVAIDRLSGTAIIECPECAAVFVRSLSEYGLNCNYCSNCGAKMEGGTEDG